MKSDWDKLMKLYVDSPDALVADVDCTTPDGKPLCERFEVRGYPTLKYGNPLELKDYKGSRHYKDLKKFAAEQLKPLCGPLRLEACDAKDAARIREYEALSEDVLAARIKEQEDKEVAAEEKYGDAAMELAAEHNKLVDAKEARLKATGVSDEELALMKQVAKWNHETAAAEAKAVAEQSELNDAKAELARMKEELRQAKAEAAALKAKNQKAEL